MIRPPRPNEIALLPQIENAADVRYARVGLSIIVGMPAHSTAVLEHGRRRGLLWVATSPRGRVVGFVLMMTTPRSAWIHQLSVLDRWQRRGLATALIDRADAEARRRGYDRVFLTTYRGVPWNEPFYRRRGFTTLGRGAFSPEMRKIYLAGTMEGHPPWRRALMVR